MIRISLPYYYLPRVTDTHAASKVYFFGADFYNLPDTADIAGFVEAENRCLDFLRRMYPEYELVYKAHPAETTETDKLDLSGFTISDDTSIGEVFLWKNANVIHAAFSAFSWMSVSARNFGLNAYVFTPVLEDAMGTDMAAGFRDYFSSMPQTFFIRDLSVMPEENRISLQPIPQLEALVRDMSRSAERLWVVASDPGQVPLYIALARLVRNSADIPVSLIIVRHHRWDTVEYDMLKPEFDEIRIIPRIFYSAQPRRILRAVRASRRVRKIPVSPGDLVFSFSGREFVDNCFLSYHKQAQHVAFLDEKFYSFSYAGWSHRLLPGDFHYTRGSWVFRFIIEPLLGLHRTIYKKYGDGRVFNIARYESGPEDIFDKVVLLKN